MSKYARTHSESDRRKARWEIILNPSVTMLVLAFCLGVLIIWVGMFENKVNPGDGVVSTFLANVYNQIAGFISSLI